MINNEWGFITLPTHTDPEQRAIARLKIASEMSLEHYKTPLLLTYSGGKDSCVLTELALRAEIPFEVLHAHTTADAPETVHFVRSEFARLENRGIRCSINYPLYKGGRTSMWDLIPRKLMPPTRVARYCSVLSSKNKTVRDVFSPQAFAGQKVSAAPSVEVSLKNRFPTAIRKYRSEMMRKVWMRCLHPASW